MNNNLWGILGFIVVAALIIVAIVFTGNADVQEPEMEYTYGEATVDAINIAIMESFPVQVSAELLGHLNDGCTEVDEVSVEMTENTFDITVATKRPVDMTCTEALVPFTESISLDVLGLEAGVYSVTSGSVTTDFELEIDNFIDADSLPNTAS